MENVIDGDGIDCDGIEAHIYSLHTNKIGKS
jgi:hypothetical protein